MFRRGVEKTRFYIQDANPRDIVSNQPENYSCFRRDISFILLFRKHRCFLFRSSQTWQASITAKEGAGPSNKLHLMKGCRAGNLLAVLSEKSIKIQKLG